MTPKLHKVPESEKAFIGSLLLLVNQDDYQAALTASQSIAADDFHDPAYKAVFGAFCRLLDRGEPFDHTLLLAELNGSVEQAAYLLCEAHEATATAAHISGHARVIRRAAEQRRALCLVQDTLNELGRTSNPSATIDKLRTKLDAVVADNTVADPIPVESYQPFPLAALPAAIANYVHAAATAIGCDASFVALPLLACLARAIGNKRVIRLKRTWTEPAVIWAAIVGKSGTHKSPALAAATTFLGRKQLESVAAYHEAQGSYEQQKALYERDLNAWRRSKTLEPPPWPPIMPACERYITTDCTIEALAKLLYDQFDGVLVARDELSGWLGGMGEYKNAKGSDLGHWLATWGALPLVIDRKSGDVKLLHIPRAAVSIVGGIQPDVLQKAIGREHIQNGLCARLLLAMPDPKPVRWTEATIDVRVEAALADVFEKLLALDPGGDSEGNPEPFALPLADSAKAVWIDYFNRHRAETTHLEDNLCAAWSKLEAYAARLALIHQLCEWATGTAAESEVEAPSIEAGIALSDWFGGEARRVYGLFSESAGDRNRRDLVELIRRRGGRITVRELQASVRQYRPAGSAEAALASLVRANLGRWVVVATDGRSRSEFVLNEFVSVNGS